MPTSALHVARTGLEAQDARMRVIANNLANVGTTGFKRDRANFATLAYQDARVAGQQSSSETAYAIGLNLGTGVSIESTTRIETPVIRSTWRWMAAAISRSSCRVASSAIPARAISPARPTASW
jgi:flagellar basal body rod protein FlgG